MKPTNMKREGKAEEIMSFAIVIPCFNEEQNIGELLASLCSGWDSQQQPETIAVFSSECRDRTDEIIRGFAEKSQIPVVLKTESEKSGKCYAINQLIEMVGDVDVIILVSSDVQVSSSSLMSLLKKFKERNVGVVAGRPVPVCDKMNLTYRISKVMWELHHLMVLQIPKSTEVTAFRNLGFRLDENSLVDEAEIEWNISKQGLSIQYCPDAIIYNKTPQSLIDHIRQRTRVTIGHCMLKRKKRYSIGSLQAHVRKNALRQYLVSKETDYLAFVLLLIIEIWVLILGSLSAYTKDNTNGKWERIDSAKKKFI